MSDIFTAILMMTGCLFCLIAAIGIARFPDTLMRMHAATKAGTLGAGLILAGLCLHYTEMGLVLRALLVLIFLYLTAPVAAHLIGRAAYRSGITLSSRTWIDHLSEDLKANPENDSQ